MLDAQRTNYSISNMISSGRRLLWLGGMLALLVVTSRYNYLLFHSLAELFSIVIAFGTFLIAWNARDHYRNDYLLFIGIAYLFVAFFDILHTLGYHGMEVFKEFPGYNLGPQLWLVGRTLEACALLVAPFFIQHPLRRGLAFAVLTLVSVAALWSIFAARNFPVCFTPESGLTVFKIVAEYVIIALLLAALVLLVRHRAELDQRVYRLLFASVLLTVGSELCFTLYISHYGLSNLIGHLFKILSFTLIYFAIIETALRRPFALLFRDLKERQDGMLAAQRAAQLGSWSWRPDRAEMRWTPEVYRQLGLVPEQTRPTLENLLAAVPHPENLTLQQALESLRRDGQGFQLEVPRAEADGSTRYLRIEGGYSVDESGRPILAGVVQDVTERVANERLREDMELIARHDMRSPLTLIIGLPELMLDIASNLSDEQRRMLGNIRECGLKMLGMINSSLTLYRIEKGTYQLQAELFDLLAALREVLGEVETKAGAQRVSLRLLYEGHEASPEDQLYCCGEKLLCQNLFANLVGNAVEASPAGGEVRIDVTVACTAWRVAIHNAGAVPEAIRPRFFDKYATYGKRGGTGLGTYSALLVARAHGGTIELESGDAGTTLTVVLPKSEEFLAAEAEFAGTAALDSASPWT